MAELKVSFHDDTVAGLSWLLKERHPATVLAMAKMVIPEMQDVVPRKTMENMVNTVSAIILEFVPNERRDDVVQAICHAQRQAEIES